MTKEDSKDRELQELISQPASYWLEYIDVVPVSESYSRTDTHQLFKFVSTVTHNRPTPVTFNDILRCDETGGTDYAFYYDYKTETLGKTLDEIEPGKVVTTPWTFLGGDDFIPPPTGSRCILRSEILSCPIEISQTESACKLQVIVGEESFVFTE